ncbi:MAG: tyrosine-type recombinase/integrase [Steroidobacteraceae bacterium]
MVATKLATLPLGDHTDPAAAGLQLRVREKRDGSSRTWLFRYRWRGEWVRLTIGHYPGTSLADARERASEFRKAIDQGIDPRRARPRRREQPAPTLRCADTVQGDKHSIEFLVSEFVHRFLRPSRKRPGYAEAILDRDVLPTWRGRDARTIDPGEVVDLLDGIVARGSPVMANRTAALLGQLFKFGIHRHIVKATPVQLLYRPGGKEKPRERVVTDVELAAFLRDPEGCTRYPKLARAMIVLLLTGQRRGELARAKWSEIDFDAKTWTIPDANAKTGRGHVVPLTDWAVEELQALKKLARESRWVLPGSTGENHIEPLRLSRGIARCLSRFKTRGIGEFTLHDLRRTCRTGLAALKIEPHIAERVLNHIQPGVVGVYDRHAYLDEKRAALEAWAAHLKGLRQATREEVTEEI